MVICGLAAELFTTVPDEQAVYCHLSGIELPTLKVLPLLGG